MGQCRLIEGVDHRFVMGLKRNVHLVDAGARAFLPVARSGGADPEIGDRLRRALPKEEGILAIVDGLEAERRSDGVVETARFREVGDNNSRVIKHGHPPP